ncbi:MAG: DUF2281 domain-containing protein [Thermodesulfovibrionia bacterium]
MTLTEKILKHVQYLPESLQTEVLDFVEYLESKVGKSKKGEDETDWSTLSLFFAMRDMENEQTSYSINNLKERFNSTLCYFSFVNP